MTQEDFARHVGIGVSTVYAAEVDLAQSRRSTLAAVALAMRMAGVQHTGGGLLMPP
jgi:DNA-binding XRE family transcriptional regulator